jgi:hypothetical protein
MRRALPLLAVVALVGCLRPPPIVQHQTHALVAGALERVAVVPFYPRPQLSRSLAPGSVSAGDAADLVARFVTEALEAGGVSVVAPSDLVIAFEGQGHVLPRRDVASNARVAARDFGASSVLLGEVIRYREREGGEFGALRPASVWFEVQLYTAPGGERLFTARFEQTQPALSENALLVQQYPGRGTRWLSAAQMTRWGADHVVTSIPDGLR